MFLWFGGEFLICPRSLWHFCSQTKSSTAVSNINKSWEIKPVKVVNVIKIFTTFNTFAIFYVLRPYLYCEFIVLWGLCTNGAWHTLKPVSQDKAKECFHLLNEETVQFVVYLCFIEQCYERTCVTIPTLQTYHTKVYWRSAVWVCRSELSLGR